MADLDADYRLLLKEELDRRIAKNPRYSLRGFSAFLRIHNSFLSKLLSGKALLSLDTADSIARRLDLRGEARARFLLSAAEEQKCHALYLIDSSLTDCHPDRHEANLRPRPRRKAKTAFPARSSSSAR